MRKCCEQVRKRIGENLRRLREESFSGYGGRKKFADSIGISSNIISHYESGRKQPSEARMKQFADFFGVNISTLRGDGDCLDEEIAWRDRKIARLQDENERLRQSVREMEESIKRAREMLK